MHRFLTLLAVITLAVTGCRQFTHSPLQECLLAQASAAATPQPASYVPGELLVQYQPGIMAASAVQEAYQLTVLTAGRNGLPDVVSVSGDLEAAAALLVADPAVRYAEPNWLLHTQQDCFSENWHLVDAGIVPALHYGPGRHGVVVAVIDTGVDVDHEELAEALLPGRNFHPSAADRNDPRPGPHAGAAHGTHVTGIVAARGNSGALGIAGFPGSIQILPIRIFDDTGNNAPASALLEALDHVTNPGGRPRADIINLSIGFRGTSTPLNEAIERAHRAGILVVVASGNNDNQVFSPANARHSFAVGSVDHGYHRSAFSNFGGAELNVMAPGGFGPSACGRVFSTIPGGYGCMAGTSMAAPLVAGAAALLLSHEPRLTPDQLWVRLENASHFDSSFMNMDEYGHGVLCVNRLLQGGNPQPGTACN